MSEAGAKMHAMRDQQLRRGMRAAACMGAVSLLCSFIQAWLVGWNDIMYAHSLIYLAVLAGAVFERRLSFSCRAAILLGATYAVALASLIVWGFGAFSLPSLFCFCVLATTFFGIRAGIVSCLASVGTIGAVGACVYAGILSFNYNAAVHLNSPVTWLVVALEVVLLVGIVVVILGTLKWQLEDLAHLMEQQNEELIRRNAALEREIAERIRVEEEGRKLTSRLREAEKMEAVGALAGGVAHDLNNILCSVTTYPELLLRELPPDHPLRTPLDDIRKTGMKAAAVVNDMLTLARRKMQPREVVNLNAVVDEYCKSAEFAALKQIHPRVRIDVCTDPNLANIEGAPFHLSRVIMNLVANACEAMPDGGQLLITTENGEISGGSGESRGIKDGSYAVLRVVDSGIGISTADLERIFEPFYSKKKMGRSGTGLGMSVVWGIVKDHDGVIDARSAEGQGTEFTLHFPATATPAPPKKDETGVRDCCGRGESILVVDDVKEQRDVASRILTRLGYAVKLCSSGEEAVERLRDDTADLVILDMIMEPGIDGVEAYRKIARIRPGQKAIIATGFAEPDRIEEALQSGVGRYLKKPYLIEEIAMAVRAELDR